MGAVEDTKKVLQDFPASELRSIAAKLEALTEKQAQIRAELNAIDTRFENNAIASDGRMEKRVDATETRLRGEITGVETRTRNEILASGVRVTAAIDRRRGDLPLLVRNAVLEQMLAEKQRVIDDFKRQAH